ncbi:ABC transporter permease [Ruania zhangjianzhongii]|uniref:ABC transporter permease n=1 Tax=Ruania zhangjianzhongii TaxID=2603206 RepID=UPI0011C9216E|nr:antibiotic ABC transporter [Ruania zhangjianzhongii]
MATQLTGTPGLMRLIVRRDRALIPVWLILTLASALGAASAVQSTYSTAAARQDRLDQIEAVPMFVLFQSQAFGSSIAALTAQQTFAVTTLVGALGAALLVARHTRGEESTGRRELLGSTGVGRHAPLAAALTVTLAAGVLVAGLIGLGLVGIGLPVTGSAAVGAVGGGAIVVSAALAAVAAQLTERPGLAGLGAFLVFFAMHYLRGVADLAGDSLSWLSWVIPNAWLEQVRPFAGTRWWPLLLALLLTGALVALAFACSARRDVGGAVFAARPGRATATPSLRGPFRLALRLQRSELVAWTGGLFALGLAMGAAGSRAMAEYADLAWVREWAAAMRVEDPADAFFVYVVFVFVLIAAIPAVLATLRLHREESGGVAATLLSVPLTRAHWAASRLAVALMTPVLLQLALGLGLGLGGSIGTGGTGQLWRALSWTMPLVPAVWVIIAVTFAAFGLHARIAPIAGWFALTLGIVAELAVKAGLPDSLYRAVSPFGAISPYYQPTVLTYLLLAAAATVLVLFGFATLRRRDLLSG